MRQSYRVDQAFNLHKVGKDKQKKQLPRTNEVLDLLIKRLQKLKSSSKGWKISIYMAVQITSAELLFDFFFLTKLFVARSSQSCQVDCRGMRVWLGYGIQHYRQFVSCNCSFLLLFIITICTNSIGKISPHNSEENFPFEDLPPRWISTWLKQLYCTNMSSSLYLEMVNKILHLWDHVIPSSIHCKLEKNTPKFLC